MNERNRKIAIVVASILGCGAILYLGGLLSQVFTNYDIWMNSGGMWGQAQIASPDWKEKLLDLLFDPDDLAVDTGNFEYDAYEDGHYVISFLDSDIIRLNRFAGSTAGFEEKTSVICYPEQAAFVRRIVGPKVQITTVKLDVVEEALKDEGSGARE